MRRFLSIVLCVMLCMVTLVPMASADTKMAKVSTGSNTRKVTHAIDPKMTAIAAVIMVRRISFRLLTGLSLIFSIIKSLCLFSVGSAIPLLSFCNIFPKLVPYKILRPSDPIDRRQRHPGNMVEELFILRLPEHEE